MTQSYAEALEQLRATIQVAGDLLNDISALMNRAEEICSQ